MDISYLQELAKYNHKFNKNEAAVSRLCAQISRKNKVERPTPKLESIQAVLRRKEELKQKEKEEARCKKENLLALRSQDRKSYQRVKAMITRTKGASKSVLEDAKDITTAKGEEQCDADDYGYESTMSQHIFSKLCNQYAKMPGYDKHSFVNVSTKCSIADIKSRVINTLKKEQQHQLPHRKRKRKSKQGTEDDFINDGDAHEDNREKKKNRDDYKKKRDRENNNEKVNETGDYNEKNPQKHQKKPRPAAPPPMCYEQLLRVAQKKQSEHLSDLKEEKKQKGKEKPQKDLGRPLTAKEKEELEDKIKHKLKRLRKLSHDKIEAEKPKEKQQKAEVEDSQKIRQNGEKIIKKQENTNKLQQALEKPKTESKEFKNFATAGQNPRGTPQIKDNKPVQKFKPPAPKTPTSTSKDFTQKDMKPPKSRDFPPKDMKPSKSQMNPPKSKVRDFLPPPPPMLKRPAYNPTRKMCITSDSEEEEEDSDMDDFIDDGDQKIDISSEIRNLFGYDKRKYQDDEEDHDMEASFSQMQKEERISAKIGLKEDLEDIRREEEERKRKKERLKQIKQSRR